jgi:hypothetical protein
MTNRYMCIHDDPALGNGLEEVSLGQKAVIVKVEELEGLVEVGVRTDFRGGLVLKFVLELVLESTSNKQ